MGSGRTTKKAVEGPQVTPEVLRRVAHALRTAAWDLQFLLRHGHPGKRRKQIRDLADELEGRAELVPSCTDTKCKL